MSEDELDRPVLRPSQPAANIADLFSAAVQQLTPPRRAAGQHQECDSDGFLDSDDNDDSSDAEEKGDVDADSSCSSASGSASSSDSEWGTFRGGEAQLSACTKALAKEASSSEGDALFVPEPIFDLSSLQHKPAMPCLKACDVQPGTRVWVVDEDDVATQLHCYFSAAYPPVCNGRLSGTVVRHSGLLTLVRFDNRASELQFALCLPTSCLSLDPIPVYESSPQHGESYGLGSGNYGMLGPRAGGRGHASSSTPMEVVKRYLYEASPAYDAERLKGTVLEAAQDSFFRGSFEKAVTAVNDFLGKAAASGIPDSVRGCCASASPAAKTVSRVDALLLRSRIWVFLERYQEALTDAKKCVELEPHWLRGYLAVARAQCGLGQFVEASAATSQACMQLPYSSEIERIQEMNSYMHSIQLQLRAEKAGCYVILDGFYRKRLRVASTTPAGVSLCRESTPIVATHSVFVAKEPPCRCSVCFRLLGTNDESSTASKGGSSGSATDTLCMSPLSSLLGKDTEDQARFCSTDCTQRASLFQPLEMKHRGALERVRSLILSRGAVTLNVLPLEMAAMAVRLFLMVVTTHRRLCTKRRLGESNRPAPESASSRGTNSVNVEGHTGAAAAAAVVGAGGGGGLNGSLNPSPSPPVYMETALQRLGVFPLCTEPLRCSKLEELKVVYDVLTADFKMEDRTVFSCDLLTQLYSYVTAYFTPVDLNALLPPDPSGTPVPHHTVYFLPNYVGCIEVAKTIAYTAATRQRDGSANAEQTPGAEMSQLNSRVLLRPPLADASASPSQLEQQLQQAAGNTAAMAESNHAANCSVHLAPRPALLDLVSVAPINVERKLRCVPVSMMLSSDVA